MATPPALVYTSPTPPKSTITAMQHQLMFLTERLHDAVWILPRAPSQTEQQAAAVNPTEYANDVVKALKSLKELAGDLPDNITDEEVARESSQLQEERKRLLEELREAEKEAKEVKGRLDARIAEFIPPPADGR